MLDTCFADPMETAFLHCTEVSIREDLWFSSLIIVLFTSSMECFEKIQDQLPNLKRIFLVETRDFRPDCFCSPDKSLSVVRLDGSEFRCPIISPATDKENFTVKLRIKIGISLALLVFGLLALCWRIRKTIPRPNWLQPPRRLAFENPAFDEETLEMSTITLPSGSSPNSIQESLNSQLSRLRIGTSVVVNSGGSVSGGNSALQQASSQDISEGEKETTEDPDQLSKRNSSAPPALHTPSTDAEESRDRSKVEEETGGNCSAISLERFSMDERTRDLDLSNRSNYSIFGLEINELASDFSMEEEESDTGIRKLARRLTKFEGKYF